MAEIAVSVALSIVEISRSLIQNSNNNSGIDLTSEMANMKTWLETMKALLVHHQDSEGSTIADQKANNSIQDIRDIAYDIEDLLEEYAYHSPPYLFHSRKIFKKIHKFGHNIRHDFPLGRMKTRISNINRKIEVFTDQHRIIQDTKFKNQQRSHASSSTPVLRVQHRVGPLHYLEDEPFGHVKPGMDFIRLLKDGDKKLLVLAVDGPCGSGKTTFVENVLVRNEELLAQFDCHALVQVTPSFNTEMLFSDMLKLLYQFREEPYPAELGPNTTSNLRSCLSEMRYLFVIDNVSRKEDWDQIKDALPSTNRGSRVIVTTRSINVSSTCVSSPEHRFSWNGLEWLHGWDLFCRLAFPKSNGVCPPHLKDSAEKIVKRCEGLPLAIVEIGHELSQKPSVPGEWEDFHKNLGDKTMGRSKVNDALRDSYLDLPSDLKCCFLYFSIFPEDCNVKYRRLIRLWVAERFVLDKGRRNAEEVAKEYLDELIQRNLVHVTNEDFDGRPRICRILNPFLNFIIKQCEDENFVSIISREDEGQTQMIRRLSIHGDWKHMPSENDFAIRSLFLSRCVKIVF